DCNESIGALVERRLGKSFLKYAVDPFLSGVYAGDPMKLVTRYALPKLYELENQYGSFIKGSIAKAKIPKTERDLLASKKVFSARGGLNHLIAAMEKNIGEENIVLRTKDVTIRPDEDSWLIQYNSPEGNECIRAKNVITTVGAYALPKMLPFVGEEDLKKLSNLRYAPVIQVSVGVLDTGALKFPAFGGLVPSCEQKEVLGILFPSSCFYDRAPENGALFSFFLGGVKHEALITRSDEEIKELVLREFRSMLKFPKTQEPDLIRIFRHEHAIPQYELSSGERFSTIERLEKQWKGLYLAGNMKGGIGMAHRILQATELAKKL
ncbi:MAG: protoporphyrinogen oxidase, partial [Bacteroidaceae bacterium]